MEKSIAFSFGQYGGIHILRDKKEYSQKILEELKNDFVDFITFADLSTSIYKTATLPDHLPDIQYAFSDYAITASSVYAFATSKIIEPTFNGKSGDHRPMGCFSITHTKPNSELGTCSIYDVMPTILNFFDIPVPKNLRGENLLQTTNKKIDITI